MPIACMSSSNEGSPEVVEKLKKPVETLSSQIKIMALNAYVHCNPCRRRPVELQRRNGSFGVGVELGELRRSDCSYAAGKWVNPVVFVEESEPKEWVAQVERGVLITFVSLPGGSNDLKRIQFSREMFDRRKADEWWAENSENLMELYNVKRQATLHGPNESSNIDLLGIFTTDQTPLLRDLGSEWVEQDEPGVYITIRALPDGRKELRRIRFRREKFREKEARLWWEENRERINKQYL